MTGQLRTQQMNGIKATGISFLCERMSQQWRNGVTGHCSVKKTPMTALDVNKSEGQLRISCQK